MNLLKKLYLQISNYHKKINEKKEYYSFSGVDVQIEFIFRNQKKGIYLDIGCQNPIKNNNTFKLYKKGWNGINIDLDIDNINLFNQARPDDININKAISSDIKIVDLFFFHKKSPLNTIDEKVSLFQKANVKNIKKIQTDTLNNVLSNSIYKNKHFDLLSIDVEGHELEVLKGFNFNIYSPSVIVVEFLDLKVKNLEIKNLSILNIINSDLYKFLIKKNYILVNCIYSDLIFVKKEFRDI
tara:strand:+ start:720 stop:1439 length:720 start_codon:yes stop_codon:yes gene_type:complete